MGLFDFVFEAAGVLGLVATLLLCMLAFAVVTGAVFWITVGVALIGTLVYLVYQFARRAAGSSGFAWRQMVMITIVPTLALVVTVLIGAQRAGLVTLPVGHRAVETQRHVISVKKKADGSIVTEQHKLPNKSDDPN
ncbi:hypothetical protein [Salinisphaera sp. Q1T1-3]|uniref:hypothetical protein n=1 Tax=Salinisphaera sp. Q1T1-3 TaxID=2321229 RepID=UPI000E72154F|nr:hypothetical protein [Salinisphaera sp. Q1T1-3]RJS92533.1 hypothetical protein D3260_11445 [Salinisphaera sp. Q1T1-3]